MFVVVLLAVPFAGLVIQLCRVNRKLADARAALGETADILRAAVRYDRLTGLPNRTALLGSIAGHSAAGDRRVVLHLDIDGFTAVNDALGHSVGDRLLVAIADRLRRMTGFDAVGRPGGDEFVLVGTEHALGGAEAAAARVLDEIRRPFELVGAGQPVAVSASVGYAVADGDAGVHDGSAAMLLANADVALRRAKAGGRNSCVRFRREMETDLQRRYRLEADLRQALERDEFFLMLQPVHEIRTGDLAGFEALLRWQHPCHGVVSPGEFVPLLEESGLIVDVGHWVLRTACREAAEWHRRGRELTISVNVSARQLERDDVVRHVADALCASGLPPHALTVEITESALVSDVAATARRLRRLRSLGVRVAVDDFGTGYSSLAYLRQFPMDCLKIDRSFVRGIGASPEADAMVRTLVQLGRSLGLATLAEGVERVDQLEYLRREEVDAVQGFLFAKPMSVEDAHDLVRSPAGRRQSGMLPCAPRPAGAAARAEASTARV